ncbi:MAG: YceI family protein [Pseudomonadota bacterium]
MMQRALLCLAALAGTGSAPAAPVEYDIDPEHTYPSFEGDHLAGLSVWRGKFNRTTGSIVLDRAARTGTVDVVVDVSSVDFGHDEMNAQARSDEFFDVEQYPEAAFSGTLAAFEDGAPTRLTGELTLHGVTRPVALDINSFKCMPHPVLERESCGADAEGSFERDEFGLDVGKDMGFDMTVKLRIQVEAVAAESAVQGEK